MDQLKSTWERFYAMRRKIATWSFFLFAAYLGVHVIFGANGWVVYQKKKAEYQQVTAEIERMKQENQQTQDQIKALQTDKKAIEKVAREQWGFARPGEVIYVLPATPPARTDTTSTALKKDSKK